MEDISITRMSSKGQVIIPLEMRKNFKEGEKILVIQNQGKLILKKATQSDENFKEDLEFARRTEEAWKEIESGRSIRVKLENLDGVMDSW